MLRLRILAWLSSVILLCACSADNLYIAHRTNLGVSAAFNSAQNSGHILVGYERRFVTVIPKSVPMKEGDTNTQSAPAPGGTTTVVTRTPPNDAMAVLSCSAFSVDGITLSRFDEYLATGQAARIYSEHMGEGTSEHKEASSGSTSDSSSDGNAAAAPDDPQASNDSVEQAATQDDRIFSCFNKP